MRTLGAAALTALLLTLAACGNGDDDQAAKAISDSIMKSQKESEGDDLLTMKQEEADCIGEGFVDEIGTEKLQKYGLITKDLKAGEGVGEIEMSKTDAKAASDTLFDCTDVSQMMSDAMKSAGQVDDKTRACLEDAVTDENLRDMFTYMFSGEDEKANEVVTTPMLKCATPPQ